MKPTIRVYLEDSYLKELSATLITYLCERHDRCYLVLDKTIFHPRGGGQPSDIGLIRGGELEFRVTKVLDVNGVLVHYGKVVSGKPEQGLAVNVSLDWGHRYLTMRHHTAGHILDYAIAKTYGGVVNTLDAFHGPPESFIVYGSRLVPSGSELEVIEKYANEIVQQSRVVRVFWVKAEELPLRAYNAPNLQRLPSADVYRVVEIEGVNAIPCTGTHVKNTIEVGEVKVLRAEHHPEGFKLIYTVR